MQQVLSNLNPAIDYYACEYVTTVDRPNHSKEIVATVYASRS